MSTYSYLHQYEYRAVHLHLWCYTIKNAFKHGEEDLKKALELTSQTTFTFPNVIKKSTFLHLYNTFH